MPYNPDKDFVHVAGFDSGQLPLAVKADSPVRSFRDLLELGRTRRITLGNFAQGSYPHMLAQQMSSHMGAQVEPVPYKGEAPMWMDLASGQIDAAMGSVLAAMPHIQAGRIRPIVVSTPNRSPLLPEVPTFLEQGHNQQIFTIRGWLGMFAPAGTPADIVKRVSDLVMEGAATPRVAQLNKTFGLPDKPWPSQEFERIDKAGRPSWIGLAKELGIVLD
jgi:tripartite-type tricarboxylate transporter receptor subunit TctC